MQQMRPGRRALAIACVAATAGAAGAIAGCGDDDTAGSAAKSTTFVGRIGYSKALVGIVTRGDTVRAYVCDGRRTGVWFDGRSSDGAIDLQARGAHLTADVGTGSVRGSVTLAGGPDEPAAIRRRLRAMAFEAVRATKNAGLYRGTARGGVAGWVVLADGTQRGVFGTKTTTSSLSTLSSKAIADGSLAITPIPIPGSTTVPFPIRISPAGGLGG